MCPEHASINHVPQDLRICLREAITAQRLNYQSLANTGLLFLRPEGQITRIIALTEASEGLKSDARKQKSPWHLVNGLGRRQSRQKQLQFYGDPTPETARLTHSHKPRRNYG